MFIYLNLNILITMKTDLVVKHNNLINASYNLEIVEQRLILLAIIQARETGQGITADSKLEIHASEYIKRFDVERQTAYRVLKEAANNLFERQFSFKEEHKTTGKVGIVRSRWVSRIKYVDDLAILELTFSPDVVPFITRLEQHFTSYQLKQVAQLTSKYAIRLYEILIAWREVGKTPVIDIADFRYKLGLSENEYKLMHQFKSRVLDPAVQQINQFTDIDVTYNQHKSGRTITGFDFSFRLKQQKPLILTTDPNTFDTLTEAQIRKYSLLLSKEPDISDLAGAKDFIAFQVWIASVLRDPNSVSKATAQRVFKILREKTDFGK